MVLENKFGQIDLDVFNWSINFMRGCTKETSLKLFKTNSSWVPTCMYFILDIVLDIIFINIEQ